MHAYNLFKNKELPFLKEMSLDTPKFNRLMNSTNIFNNKKGGKLNFPPSLN
jgi:hypothetical protein